MSVYCTACGTRRTESAKYCTHCEAGFEEAHPTRATEAPTSYGQGWYVSATVVLAVVVTLAIIGLNALIVHSVNGKLEDSAAHSRIFGSKLDSNGYIVPAESNPTSEEGPTWTPSPTEEETTEPTFEPTLDPTPTQEPTLGNDLVSITPEAARDPAASAVVELLTTYYRAINEHDYPTYEAQQTRAAQALLTRSDFATGFRSTVNSEVVVQALTPTADGRLLASVTFTSSQDAADGPKGQTCTHWAVGKFLKGRSPTLLIDKAPKGYKATFDPC
ncbi:hypothetical protein EV138_2207 [Kribbella voronezhensis]|uniref:Uncharacterized protein n=1 Tax=Kribbella voronezhensis TaxID=2512212 RepID=A0A4R7T9N1_9ACTN|nr:hypothetical protein [Kribbella voronezhensis]TDU88661.1 hypothetical protein EV138_2207 [Kribbella voronezhensis]